MKILVYGAGNIGSLYAAKLKQAGNDVNILARGKRFDEIHEHGILLQNFHSGQRTTTCVNVVERLNPEDTYEFVLVILPRQSVSEVLPILAANQNSPNVVFFGNNAAGPDEMIDTLGQERVLLGFPGAAAVRRDETIQYIILDRREQPTTIGELDGSDSSRIKAITTALQSAEFPTSNCSNMDAWLKTHVAEISPTANAFYMAETDIAQLKRNRQALVLMLRAIREGYCVLSALGVPVTPSSHKLVQWIPEFMLVAIARRKLNDDTACIKIGHARAARAEMKAIANEFRVLARRSGVTTPAIDQLRACLFETEPSVGEKDNPHVSTIAPCPRDIEKS